MYKLKEKVDMNPFSIILIFFCSVAKNSKHILQYFPFFANNTCYVHLLNIRNYKLTL